MNKRFLIIALTISIAINLAALFTIGFYWWERRSFKRGITPRRVSERYDWRRSPLSRRLNLTEEQIEVINKQHEEMRSKMLPLTDELFKKRRELTTLLWEAPPDRERTDTLQREIASLQFKVDSQVFENLCQIKDILTPEQQKQFFKLFEKRQLYPRGMRRPPLGKRSKQKGEGP